jgi:hypothetical protein
MLAMTYAARRLLQVMPATHTVFVWRCAGVALCVLCSEGQLWCLLGSISCGSVHSHHSTAERRQCQQVRTSHSYETVKCVTIRCVTSVRSIQQQ